MPVTSDQEVSDVTEPTEASGSSDVDALVAAMYGYESRVISEREARDRLWWFSLQFVDIQSTGQGIKRKHESLGDL